MKSPVTAIAAALGSGVVFGLGLALAQMTNPQKIKDFLDIAAIPAGGWDPSLVFVMGGAAVVAFVGLRLDRVMRAPLAAPAFVRGTRTAIDRPLVAGAAIFGVGWGLSGLCPGPAIADLAIMPQAILPFVAAMLVGSWGTGWVLAALAAPGTTATVPDAASE
ncbi:MAG TPA: YeeE/YedE family protein [Bauldia sp.]|nr:YeeE/YedE family protein [Bauldia sp.]